MTLLASAIGPSAYWYLTRSSGWVALLLLTASVVLGVLDVNRWSTSGWPRFVLDSLHRSVSLLVLVFVALHIVTAALDSFATISLLDAVVPFIGSYRPIWLGLGAVAFDLLLALAITSLLRQRLGHRTWRIVHWLAYACWPIALVHGLGTGSDVKSVWSLTLTAMCVIAVMSAVCARALHGWPEHVRLRASALGLSALIPIALIVWLPGGPLGHGWARRSGTPIALLGASPATAPSSQAVSSTSQAGPPSSPSGLLSGRFAANLSGTIQQGPGPAPRLISIKIATSFTGSVAGRLEIEIDGPPVGDGGVSLQSSSVTLGSPPTPVVYHGRIVALDGDRLLARVRNGEGRSLTLRVTLAVNASAGTVSGTLAAAPAADG